MSSGALLSSLLEVLTKKRTEKRLGEFAAFLHQGESVPIDFSAIIESDAWECLLVILQAVESDDEAIKTRLYAETFKAILNDRVSDNPASDFLRALRVLRFADLLFLFDLSSQPTAGDETQQARLFRLGNAGLVLPAVGQRRPLPSRLGGHLLQVLGNALIEMTESADPGHHIR